MKCNSKDIIGLSFFIIFYPTIYANECVCLQVLDFAFDNKECYRTLTKYGNTLMEKRCKSAVNDCRFMQLYIWEFV